jgi:hypothetical protein
MPLDEAVKKAFDFAADLSKQLITLATGIVGLALTVGKDHLREAFTEHRALVIGSLAIFLASVLFGVLTLMALTGVLDQDPARKAHPISIRCPSVRIYSAMQAVLFLGAMALMVTCVIVTTR